MKRLQVLFALAALVLTLSMLSQPAQASGGPGAGGNHGGAGAGSIVTTTISQLNLYGSLPFNGVLPQGHVIFSYSADFTFKSVELDITHVNIADGTVLTVIFTTWGIVSGRPQVVSTSEYPLTIINGAGTLSMSSALTPAEWIPFLPPARTETTVAVDYVTGPDSFYNLVGAVFGAPILP